MKTLLANIEEKESRVMKKCLGTTVYDSVVDARHVLFSTNARAEIFGFNLPNLALHPRIGVYPAFDM
jgi:hypothetical protein